MSSAASSASSAGSDSGVSSSRSYQGICVSSPEAPEPDGSSSAGTGAGAVGWTITGSAAASSGSDSSSSSDGETNCAKKAAAGESLSSADKEASSASPAGSSDPDEAPASQERSAEEPSPSAGASPESAGAGSGGNGSSGVACTPAEGTGAPRAGEASSEATTALAEEAGEASSQPADSTGESAGVPHATSPTVPDASVATGRTALITCHRQASDAGPSTGVAIRQPECVRKRCSDHVMTLPPLTDVGPSGPSTTTSKAPRTAMCASLDSSMSATKLGSAARLAAKAEVSSWRRTARSAPSSMSSQNRWASASLPGSRTTIPRSVTAAG